MSAAERPESFWDGLRTGFWEGARTGFVVGNLIGLPALLVLLIGPTWTWRLVLVGWLVGWGLWLVDKAVGATYLRDVSEVRPELRYRPHLIVRRGGWLFHIPGSRWLHTGALRSRIPSPSTRVQASTTTEGDAS